MPDNNTRRPGRNGARRRSEREIEESVKEKEREDATDDDDDDDDDADDADEVQDAEASERGVKWLLAQREGQRKIKLHDQQQKKGKSLRDAVVVRKTARLPDMRFAEDAVAFKPDPSKRLDGKPDGRFLDNREDLLAVHARRGDNRPNFIFTDDMGAIPEEAEAEA